MEKIRSYIGFAIKSRNIVYGTDNILKSKAKLVIVSDRLSQNAIDKLNNKFHKVIIIKDETFAELGSSALALAILDSSLANAIKNNL